MTPHEQNCLNEQVSRASCLQDEKRIRRKLEAKFDRMVALPWDKRRARYLELERMIDGLLK